MYKNQQGEVVKREKKRTESEVKRMSVECLKRWSVQMCCVLLFMGLLPVLKTKGEKQKNFSLIIVCNMGIRIKRKFIKHDQKITKLIHRCFTQSITVLIIFYKLHRLSQQTSPETLSHHILFTLNSLSTCCTWRLCCGCVSDSAVVDRRDSKLVGNSWCQPTNGVTPGLRVLNDAVVPNWWADPLCSPLPRSVAAVPPSRSLWQPHVLQNETCQTASLLVLYLPLQVHLIPPPAVVRHTDQRCVWWHWVPWWEEKKVIKRTQ